MKRLTYSAPSHFTTRGTFRTPNCAPHVIAEGGARANTSSSSISLANYDANHAENIPSVVGRRMTPCAVLVHLQYVDIALRTL